MEKITLGELIASIDKHKRNAYSDEQKTKWVSKVEGRIQVEIMKKKENLVSYSFSSDRERELLVPRIYADLYRWYVYAMIDFENEEIGSYNNDIVMFNSEFNSYQSYYRALHGESLCIQNIW